MVAGLEVTPGVTEIMLYWLMDVKLFAALCGSFLFATSVFSLDSQFDDEGALALPRSEITAFG